MFPCEMQEQATRPTLAIRFRAPVQELPKHFERVYGTIIQYLGELDEEHTVPAFAAYYNLVLSHSGIDG